MQPLSPTQQALLEGRRLRMRKGAIVLNFDLTVNTAYGTNGDISGYLRSATATRDMDEAIHGKCMIDLALDLPWGMVLILLYVVIGEGAAAERINVGVYYPTTPETPLGQSPTTLRVPGQDRLYLLHREVGEDYSIPAGMTYYDALSQVFTDAGLSGVLIDGAAGDYTLPSDKPWPLIGTDTDPNALDAPTTWLQIVNGLQEAWNGQGVWADPNGFYRCEQYQPPANRAPEYEINRDALGDTIGVAERVRTADASRNLPNRWVFRWKNRPGGMSSTVGDGVYVYDLPDEHPMSAVNRRLPWVKTYDYDAASQPVLESIGNARVARDLALSTKFTVTTGPFPVAGHHDVFTYVDSAAGGTFKVQVTDWEFDLNGGNVRWTWEVIG